MEVLYISNFVPYKEIKHAGGKTFYYYFSNIQNVAEIHTTLVGLCNDDEIPFFRDNAQSFYYISTKGTVPTNIRRVVLDAVGKICRKEYPIHSFYKYQKIMNRLRMLKQQGYIPDVVVLEWTEMVLMVKEVRSFFPNAKYVASEHDVSFLARQRQFECAAGKERKKLIVKFEREKAAELEALRLCDVAMPQNEKDKALLMDNGIPEKKIHVLTPYYHDMRHIVRKEPNHDILFWGAMYRPENYEAAIWFIEQVMPLLEDLDVRFVAAGNRPPELLRKYDGGRVWITGFVEDEAPLFENSMCFVSPLLTGAGIKVKIIEAMSAGIPVLTNDIGIEGIPAVDEQSYFHCTIAEEYAEIIRRLYHNPQEAKQMEIEQRKLIAENFNLEESFSRYTQMLKD